MTSRLSRTLALTAGLMVAAPAPAAPPQIGNLSPHGLQTGATTTVTVEGSNLLPDPRVLLTVPIAAQVVKPGASANRVQIDVTLAADVRSGFYHFRIANAHGISNAVPVGIDDLPQLPLAAQVSKLPAALHGHLSGSDTIRTAFAGQKGQRVVVEVEARRLGSTIDPHLSLHDARGTQLAWSQGLPRLAGDARIETVLPANGEYSVQLRDILYRAGSPGHFRLKVGPLHYADLVFPLGGQRGTKVSLELLGSLPGNPRVEAYLTDAQAAVPAPLSNVPNLTGSVPQVVVGSFPEVLEAAPAAGKLQEVPAPAVINGRLARPGEEDRYRVLVKPGMRLRFEVLAQRAGAPLDGVLVLRNDAGTELARADDGDNTTDPGLDYVVPDGTNAVIAAVTDLIGRGGPDHVYRLEVRPLGQPDFSLTLLTDRVHVPQSGTALLHVRANRMGYDGPIRLTFPGLPEGTAVAAAEIPAGGSGALVSLTTFPGAMPAQTLAQVAGEGIDDDRVIRRFALTPPTPLTGAQPWLRRELAAAVVGPLPFSVAWDTNDPILPVGGTYPATVKVLRGPGVNGPVRLSLLTSQVVPKMANSQEDDPRRAIRIENPPTIPADQSSGTATVTLPGDLLQQPYDLAIQAELLSPDGKSVIATAITPSRRLRAVRPKPQTVQADPKKALPVFEDQAEFVANLTEGGGVATLEEKDKYSGKASVKITPDQRYNSKLPGLGVKIRENPGPGEYRYLRFAWKKKGGETICLQLNHDDQWGPTGGNPAKFRYHAGPGPECYGASDAVDEKLPAEWTVVTRDLFKDYGEFTLTGIALSPVDGEYALFDHIYLARTPGDFEAVKKR